MSTAAAADADQNTGPTVRRMILGTQLRRLRESKGITRGQAGYHIRASESKISRLELGRVSFKERDVVDLLQFYGENDPAVHEQFVDLVRQAKQPGWWHSWSDGLPKWFNDFVGLEEASSQIRMYEPLLIPGLLQTQDYAARLISAGVPHTSVGAESVDAAVALRIQRQKLLARPDAPRLWAVIDESVLSRVIGSREIMIAQIDKLLEMTALPHISLQIVPYANSGYAAVGGFVLLRFAEVEIPNTVFIEYLGGALYLEREGEIEAHYRAFDRLTVNAETPEKSREILANVRASL